MSEEIESLEECIENSGGVVFVPVLTKDGKIEQKPLTYKELINFMLIYSVGCTYTTYKITMFEASIEEN